MTPANAQVPNSQARTRLIGIPYQIIVGPRSLANGMIEVKTRAGGAREEISLDAAINRFAGN